MAEQLPRVRDIDPLTLLGAHPSGQALQPYVPRDVDTVLDKAFSLPGLVLVVHESSSGARRTVYESLLRTLPDHHLAVEKQASSATLVDTPTNTVLWVDQSTRTRTVGPPLVRGWLTAGRYAVVIVNQGYTQLATLRDTLSGLNPTLVEIRNQLSQDERLTLSAGFTGSSVDDLIHAVSRLPKGTFPHVAGYHADTDEGQDWLGITKDVNMLADLVVSRHVDPPLSIGLFGNWGSGKSFFMRQMQNRMNALAKASTAEEKRVGKRDQTVSTYCATVKQITFNAWHYTEANLWASLATHIFDALASEASEDVLKRRAEELAKAQKDEQSLLTQLSMVHLESILVAAQQDSTPVFPELTAEDRAWFAEATGTSEATIESMRAFAEDLRGLRGKARHAWSLLRSNRLALAACVGLVAVGIALFVWSPSWQWLVGLVPILVGGTAVFARVWEAAKRIRRAARNATTAREQRLAELAKQAEQLEHAIAGLAAQHKAAAFAKSRHESEDYRQHLGIVSRLRRDLETFAAMLRRERHDVGGLERVVLYIDDLDRCPPDVVVKVLEAVHLLVALPVFVVVVAVDPRWLHQAIRHHYEAMFLTPAHYLEKIFQIPFQLPEMDQHGFARLMRGLSVPKVVASGSETVPVPAPEVVERDEPDPTVGFAPTAGRREGGADLRPQQLDITDYEVEFLSRLAPLVATPRAAKRMVNLYRLVRARLQDSDIEWFVADGKFQAVVVLLALHAESGVTAFDRIEADDDLSWLAEQVGVDVSVESCREWLPLVRRFSFGQKGTAPDAVGGGRSVGDG